MPKTDREILEEFMVSRDRFPVPEYDEGRSDFHNQYMQFDWDRDSVPNVQDEMMRHGVRSLERKGLLEENPMFTEGKERLGKFGDEAAVIDPSLLYPGAGQASPHGDDIYGFSRPKLESEGYHDNTMDELRRLRELGHDYYQGRRMVDPRERPPQSFINRE